MERFWRGAKLHCLLLVEAEKSGGLPRRQVWSLGLPLHEGGGQRLEANKQQGCMHTQEASVCPRQCTQADLG